jgi:hypothetical protein
MKVLHGLGIAETVASKLRPFPNGNTAMNAMAACEDPHVIGCTQVTEILITQGVDLVANLPIKPIVQKDDLFLLTHCSASRLSFASGASFRARAADVLVSEVRPADYQGLWLQAGRFAAEGLSSVDLTGIFSASIGARCTPAGAGPAASTATGSCAFSPRSAERPRPRPR